MTPAEQDHITRWNAERTVNSRITLRLTKDHRSLGLDQFCCDLARLAPKIRVHRVKGEPEDLPAIGIGRGLYYYAVPLGPELEPFLEALSITGEKVDAGPSHYGSPGWNDMIDQPIALRLYVSQHCPFCPTVVQKAVTIVSAQGSATLAIVDCDLFPEMARSDGIKSVPTLLLNEKLRWTGSFDTAEITDALSNQDPVGLSASSLERILKEGRAAQLAGMMLERETIFPSFLDLLADDKWPTRLGAMVALEEITAQNPQLALRVIDPLWERFHHAPNTVKGDIVYVLGESGGREAVTRLEAVLDGDYDAEIKEAAREALEKIRNP